jgi:hypothetical protein
MPRKRETVMTSPPRGLRPMKFDPSQPAILHDVLNDRILPSLALRADQCDISTGTVIAPRIPRVTPPRMNSRRRE